jgi:type IV secretion system protein VirB8
MGFFPRRPAVQEAAERLTDTRLAEHHLNVRSLGKREINRARAGSRLKTIGLFGEGAVILGLTYALASLAPAVRLVPLIVQVRSDGTHAVEPLMSMMPATTQDAVLRATLWTYVEMREGYSSDSAKVRHDTVVALSDTAIGQAYSDWFNYPNPASPQIKYGKAGIVTIDKDSADFLTSDPSIYQVSYWRTVTVPGRTPSRSHWTAYVHYHLVDAIPLVERDTVNPGAVKVIGYPPPQENDAPPTKSEKAPQ